MRVTEILAWIILVFLAVYGCAQLIRRLCLWATRCPACAVCCRVAVPKAQASLGPLMRCLQSQAAWGDPGGCRYTLLLLSEDRMAELAELEAVLQDTPAVLPVTADHLNDILILLAKDCQGKE